jgi:hypothetical protein
VPEVSPLEGRSLQTVITSISTVLVHPGLLPNTPDGRFVPVKVFGELATLKPEKPSGLWFVTDEYRSVEPHGTMTLTPAGSFHHRFPLFAFSFTVDLQERRSTNTPDGRHYDLFVGAIDADGAGGKTVAVYVPKTLPPAAHTAAVTTSSSDVHSGSPSAR